MLTQWARLRQGQQIMHMYLHVCIYYLHVCCIYLHTCSCISLLAINYPQSTLPWPSEEQTSCLQATLPLSTARAGLATLTRGPAGTPPKAKAKGVAVKAEAKTASAGKAEAQAKDLGKGGGAVPTGALRPPGPSPVATRR